MKNLFTTILLFALFFISNPLLAQTIEISSGTTVPLTVTDEYSSKNIMPGQKIQAIVEDDVNIKGTNVFKKGNSATINISDVKKAGFMGIPGELYIVNGEVTDNNGIKHGIEYNEKITGVEKTWPKACFGCGMLIILAPIALFGFVKGGQAKILPNKVINVQVRNDFRYNSNTL